MARKNGSSVSEIGEERAAGELNSKSLLAACLDTLGSSLVLLDAKGRVAGITAPVAVLLGAGPAELEGAHWETLWAGHGDPAFVFSSEPRRTAVVRSGKDVPVRAWLRPLPGTGFSIVGLEDLSEEDRQEREVVRILRELQEQSDDLFALYQITQMLNNAQDIEQMCVNFLRELERTTAAHISCLYLVTPSGELQPQVWHGTPEAPPAKPDLSAAFGWLNSLAPDSRLLSLQLHAEDRLVGLALLAHQKDLGRRQRFLQTVAKEMGTALLAMQGRQALLAQEQKLEAIVESTTDGLIQVDRDLLVRDFNPAAVRLTGLSEHDALLHSCGEVLGCVEGAANGAGGCGGQCPFRQVLASREPIPYAEIVVGGGSSEPRYLAASVAALDLGTHPGAGAVGILRDMSKIKQIEQMKDDFFAAVSHQLRTPLALLRGYSDTLQHLALSPEEKRACIDGIADTTSRLEHLVEQVLDVTRIEDGRFDLQLERTRFVDIMRVSLNSLPQTAHRSRIWAEIAPDLPPLNVDPARMEEVLTNLLDNALKYSSPGRQVVVKARETKSKNGQPMIMVQVFDEGIGIPLADQQAMFTKFHRAGNARSLQIPGTGLGLFICRSIIEAHGGHIMLASTPGDGTCITFWVPATADEES